MSAIQRFFKAILPKRWAEDMEADSRRWKLHCPCGASISIWDIGGIRWRAVGEQRTYRKCHACGKRTWQKVSKNPQPSPGDAPPPAPPSA